MQARGGFLSFKGLRPSTSAAAIAHEIELEGTPRNRGGQSDPGDPLDESDHLAHRLPADRLQGHEARWQHEILLMGGGVDAEAIVPRLRRRSLNQNDRPGHKPADPIDCQRLRVDYRVVHALLGTTLARRGRELQHEIAARPASASTMYVRATRWTEAAPVSPPCPRSSGSQTACRVLIPIAAILAATAMAITIEWLYLRQIANRDLPWGQHLAAAHLCRPEGFSLSRPPATPPGHGPRQQQELH